MTITATIKHKTVLKSSVFESQNQTWFGRFGRKMAGFILAGAGLTILFYLAFVFLRFTIFRPPSLSPSVAGLKTETKTTSFARLITQPSDQKDRVSDDPGLKISRRDLDSFGKLLGLKTEQPSTLPILSEFYISVPALDITDGRVKVGVDGTDEKKYLPVLKEAIAHFQGTALPGEFGNVFLFGHSMIPVLAGHSYESIFTNLPKLKTNDLIFVRYGIRQLTYRVRQTAVVSPQNIFVLKQPKSEKLLTLMTCIPPGFGPERFIAIAELVGED